LRIINLETSVTRSEDYWKGKGINYRMSPANIRSLTEARIDACALANNHVLDWGYKGLAETLTTLRSAGLKSTGAGENEREADDPAELAVPGKGMVQLLSFGVESSGIPRAWGASAAKPAVNLLPDLSQSTVTRIAKAAGPLKAAGCVIISLHWGSNWDFEVTKEERVFAHNLIDEAGADVVYGHSSHHVKGIEIYHDRLILYGCGDFINDYEGIKGFHDFRGDLGLMYFANLDAATGSLKRLTMFPTTVSQFRIQKASNSGVRWLSDTLNREGRRFGTGVQLLDDDTIVLQKLQTKETF
jgi:poly-gamma-glutamate capsule biosynthesis protein CapA/YwtB (metallophosphatase superfamily)